MSRPLHWTIAGAAAIALHGIVLGIASAGRPTADMERSAGQPGAVWGLPTASIAEAVSPVPAQAASTAAEPDPVETASIEPVESENAEVVEPVPTESTVEVEPQTATEPDRPVETATAPTSDTAVDVPSQPAVTESVETAATAEPVEANVAVGVSVAALSPIAQEEVVEAESAGAPVPRARPDDLPRSAPPVRKTATKPAPAPQKTRQAKTSGPSSTTATGSSTPSAAPAGEQAGTGGVRQADGGRQMVSSYAGRVASHLQRFKRYPADAADQRLSGTATITFTLGTDGRVRGAKLSRSSGLPVFDREVLAMVDRAEPFPPIPASIGKGAMTFTVPVNFRPR